MPDYTYLIVGGGMAAEAALHGIREADPNGSIGLVGREAHPPYNRPPLTKGLWKDKPLESIWRKADGLNVTFHLGRTARALNPKKKSVTDDKGEVYTYKKLLLATGGKPQRLPFGDDQILYYRTLDDYQRLRALTQAGERFAVIGGGFIGSEIAAALAMNGKEVTMVFPEEGIGSRMFPRDLTLILNDYYRKKRVEVLAGELVTDLETREDKTVLKVRSAVNRGKKEIIADGVVAGIGIRPETELAEGAGLEVDNGIKVGPSLRTSQPDIFAAGDAASFHNPVLFTQMRVEHEDNANTMGRTAGLAMAGEVVSYDHLPFFYSDLFELGYEAVGEVDPRLETVADWKEPYREGVVYYLRQGRVRGVLLWNVWEQVEAARQLIGEAGPFRAADLKGRLPA